MLLEFKNNKNAKETAKKMYSVYGQGVIIDCQVWKWFSKFYSSDMSLRDEPRPRHSSDLNQDALRELLKCNPYKSTWELGLDFNTSQSTICCHLKKIGNVSELGICVSYNLCEKNKEDI